MRIFSLPVQVQEARDYHLTTKVGRPLLLLGKISGIEGDDEICFALLGA